MEGVDVNWIWRNIIEGVHRSPLLQQVLQKSDSCISQHRSVSWRKSWLILYYCETHQLGIWYLKKPRKICLGSVSEVIMLYFEQLPRNLPSHYCKIVAGSSCSNASCSRAVSDVLSSSQEELSNTSPVRSHFVFIWNMDYEFSEKLFYQLE